MTVKCDSEKVGEYVVLRLYGDMLGSVGNSCNILATVSELIRKGSKNLVFDVSSLQSPSSDLVNIIARTHKTVVKDNGSVGVVYHCPSETDIFERCGVYGYARHYSSSEVFENYARKKHQ